MSAAAAASIPLWASVPTAYAAPAAKASRRKSEEEVFELIGRRAQEVMARDKLPGMSVGVMRGGKLVYARAFGVKSVATGARYTTQSVQGMQSTSKNFAATAIMQLVEAGKMNVDRPLVEYLPYFKLHDPRYPRITIRQILAHRSGLPFITPKEMADGENGEFLHPWFDAGAAERYVRSLDDPAWPIDLLAEPGAPDFNYSDLGYDILADVIHKVSGELFEDYCRRHLFEPLGMKQTTFLPKQVPPGRLVSPHVLDASGKPVVSKVYPYARQHAPSSCLHSNVPDMSRWVAMNLNHGSLGRARILSPSSQAQLWTPLGDWPFSPNSSAGWGCTIHNELAGARTIGLYGGFLVQTSVEIQPSRGLTAMAFTNRDSSSDMPDWATGDVCNYALEQMAAL